MSAYNIIITAAFIGYHITERDAVEIAALFSGDNLTETIRNYCSAYES
jgi:hypothetical protein